MAKTTRTCDCCGRPAKHNVTQYDSFYEYLCDACYEEWSDDHDTSWDNEF